MYVWGRALDSVTAAGPASYVMPVHLTITVSDLDDKHGRVPLFSQLNMFLYCAKAVVHSYIPDGTRLLVPITSRSA